MSVIVPVYNVEAYLEECLESVIVQTLKDIEIVCVNDASTDGSLEILQKYAKKYKNLKIVSQPHNMGLAAARNAGISVAKGEYVYFLDSDDWIERESLERLYNRAKKERLDMLFFDTHVFGKGIDKRKIDSSKRYYMRSHDYPEIYKGVTLFSLMNSQQEYLCSACLYISRRLFMKEHDLKFYEGILHEDELFTFQAMIRAKRCGYLAEKFYHRRLHPVSIMSKKKTFDNVKGILIGAWQGAEDLTGEYTETERKEVMLRIMEMSRYALEIYRGLDSNEQARIKELPMAAQLRLKEMLLSAENTKAYIPKQGMLVYGAGAHLDDMLLWHPELKKNIARIFDKDPEKIGLKANGMEVVIESPEKLRSLQSGTQVAVSALRYYEEIVKELHGINPGLVCPDIDEAYRQMKEMPAEAIDKVKKDNKLKPKLTKIINKLSNLQCMRIRGSHAQARWRQRLLLASNGCRHVFWGTKGLRAMHLRHLYMPMMRQGDFFIDEDKDLRGHMLDGMPICVPEILRDLQERFLIIVLSDDYEQVRIKLIDYGYVENVDFVEGCRLLGEDENGYINVPCVDKPSEGMIVYGSGAHLMDMFEWHPEIARHIKRIIDKDIKKSGTFAPKCGVPIEPFSVLKNLPFGTEIAVSAIRYIDEITKDIKQVNSGLICRNIDDIWQEYV